MKERAVQARCRRYLSGGVLHRPRRRCRGLGEGLRGAWTRAMFDGLVGRLQGRAWETRDPEAAADLFTADADLPRNPVRRTREGPRWRSETTGPMRRVTQEGVELLLRGPRDHRRRWHRPLALSSSRQADFGTPQSSSTASSW